MAPLALPQFNPANGPLGAIRLPKQAPRQCVVWVILYQYCGHMVRILQHDLDEHHEAHGERQPVVSLPHFDSIPDISSEEPLHNLPSCNSPRLGHWILPLTCAHCLGEVQHGEAVFYASHYRSDFGSGLLSEEDIAARLARFQAILAEHALEVDSWASGELRKQTWLESLREFRALEESTQLPPEYRIVVFDPAGEFCEVIIPIQDLSTVDLNDVCAIDQEKLREDESGLGLCRLNIPGCNHVWHTSCMRWLMGCGDPGKRSCPMCRREVQGIIVRMDKEFHEEINGANVRGMVEEFFASVITVVLSLDMFADLIYE